MSNPAPRPAPRPAEAPDEPVATDEGVLRADVVAELAKLRSIRDEAASLSDEEKERLTNVRDAVRSLPAGEYTDEAGRKVLTLSWPASFDATLAEGLPDALRAACSKRSPDAGKLEAALADGTITREQYDAITVERVDAGLAKENLPPKMWATCLRPSANPTVKPVHATGGKGKGRGGR